MQLRPRQDPLHVRGENFSSALSGTQSRAARGMGCGVAVNWSIHSASRKPPSAAMWTYAGTRMTRTSPASRPSAEEGHADTASRMCGTGLSTRTHTWQPKMVSSRPQKAVGNKPANGPELLGSAKPQCAKSRWKAVKELPPSWQDLRRRRRSMNASGLLLTEADAWKMEGAQGERLVMSSLKPALSSFSAWLDSRRGLLRSRLRLRGRLGSA